MRRATVVVQPRAGGASGAIMDHGARLGRVSARVSFRDNVATEAQAQSAPGTQVQGHEGWWLCAACDARVAPVRAAFAMANAHRHVFINPLGFAYEIGCFRTAPGCRGQGAPTLEHTWFRGYSWCHVLCARCAEHLGWRYQRGAEEFFGLILQRLREDTRP